MAASQLVFSSLARRAEKVGVSTPPRVLLVAGGQNLARAWPGWAAGWAERASSSPGARRDVYAQGRYEGKRADVLLASGGDVSTQDTSILRISISSEMPEGKQW